MKLNLAPFIFLAFLAACSSGDDEAAGDSSEPVALVTLATAKQGAISQQLKVYGLVQSQAAGSKALLAPSQAVVTSIDAPAGSNVNAGDTVLSLEAGPESQVALAQATADAKAAADALARSRRLRKDGLASDADVAAAQAMSTKAAALQESLQMRQTGLTVKAPFAGRVQSIDVKVGDLVTLGTRLGTLIQVSPGLRLRLGVDPTVARRIGPGTPVSVDLPGGGQLDLSLGAVDAAASDATRLVSAWVDLPANAKGVEKLVPGENVAAHISVQQSSQALLVPYAALLADGGQPFVYVVKDGVAHRHNVDTGPDDGQQIAIGKGISVGDKVVTSGGTALEDGMKVRLK